jgi:electron transfer flavoprotein alpha subunit
MANVLVVAEVLDRALRKTTLSAVTAAKQLAGAGHFDIVVVGDGAEQAALAASELGARKVLVADVPDGYLAERYAPTVAAVAKAGAYGILVATASTYGKDLMPRVAARLGAGIASDIAAIEVQGDKAVYRRPMYAGNVLATVEIATPIHVVTVRQSEFEAAEPPGGASPTEPATVETSGAASRVRFVGLESVPSERPDLAEAQVVVSGGRALKSEDNFKNVLEPLVDVLGAAMGASRAACDAGYVPNDLQVGQTGKVVAPKLYIAVGISGAIQHLAGMKSSKVIVAINKDKEAPIAQVADYFWVADLFQAVPELTAELKKVKGA